VAADFRRDGVRFSLVWDVLRDVVSARAAETCRQALDIIDVGGGTGGLAVAVCRPGAQRSPWFDPSPDALARLPPGGGPPRAGARLTAVQGEAASLDSVAGPKAADPCHLPQRAGIRRLAVRRDDRDRRRASPGRHGERAGGERGGRGPAPGPGRPVHRGPPAAGDRRRGRDAAALYPARADRAHRGRRAARRRGARAADLQRSCARRAARRGRGRGRRNRGTARTRGGPPPPPRPCATSPPSCTYLPIANPHGRHRLPHPARGHGTRSTRAWRSGTSPSWRAGRSSSAEPAAGAWCSPRRTRPGCSGCDRAMPVGPGAADVPACDIRRAQARAVRRGVQGGHGVSSARLRRRWSRSRSTRLSWTSRARCAASAPPP